MSASTAGSSTIVTLYAEWRSFQQPLFDQSECLPSTSLAGDEGHLTGPVLLQWTLAPGTLDDADLPGVATLGLDEFFSYDTAHRRYSIEPGLSTTDELSFLGFTDDDRFLTEHRAWTLARGLFETDELSFLGFTDDDHRALPEHRGWTLVPGFLDTDELSFLSVDETGVSRTRLEPWSLAPGFTDDADLPITPGTGTPDEEGRTAGPLAGWLLSRGFLDDADLPGAVYFFLDEDLQVDRTHRPWFLAPGFSATEELPFVSFGVDEDPLPRCDVRAWALAPGFRDDADLPGARYFFLDEDFQHAGAISWAWRIRVVHRDTLADEIGTIPPPSTFQSLCIHDVAGTLATVLQVVGQLPTADGETVTLPSLQQIVGAGATMQPIDVTIPHIATITGGC